MRVCPYARQECKMAAGCATFGWETFGMARLDAEARALACKEGGAMLYAGEIKSGELNPKKTSKERAAFKAARLATLDRMLFEPPKPLKEKTLKPRRAAAGAGKGKRAAAPAVTQERML